MFIFLLSQFSKYMRSKSSITFCFTNNDFFSGFYFLCSTWIERSIFDCRHLTVLLKAFLPLILWCGSNSSNGSGYNSLRPFIRNVVKQGSVDVFLGILNWCFSRSSVYSTVCLIKRYINSLSLTSSEVNDFLSELIWERRLTLACPISRFGAFRSSHRAARVGSVLVVTISQ